MGRLLHISTSPRGEASLSRRVARDFGAALRQSLEGLETIERDLAARPIPHPDRAFAAANLTPESERTEADRHAQALSEELIVELESADLVIISSPMHNFTVPSSLKAWLDHVVRPGRTFQSTATGKIGLLKDRPVFVIVACGGPFSDGQQTDFFSPYLRYVLGTVGLNSVEMLRLEELNRGPQSVQRALDAARGWIELHAHRVGIEVRG